MAGKGNIKCAKCGITSKEDSSLTFHRFPLPSMHGSLKAEVWAKFCFPNDDWTSCELLEKLYKQHKMLCGNHFDNSSFTSIDRKRLNKFAIPTGAQNILDELRNKQCNPPKEIQKTTIATGPNLQIPTVDSAEEEGPKKDTASVEKQTEEAINVSDNSPNKDDLSWKDESDTVLVPQEPENTEPKQDVFSWEVGSEPELVHQDEPEHIDDVPDDLSMYCDDDAATVTTKEVNRTGWHQGFNCDNCSGDIVGFRYTCVQCSNLDLCVTCESSGAHAHHYMLRVPGPRPYNEIQTVLARIRKHLMKEFDPISADNVDNEDAISVKSEIKSEDEEEDIEKIEQVEAPAEDTVTPEAEQRSRLSSPESSQCSEDADCEVVMENNRPVQRPVKISTPEKNRNPLTVTSLNNIESPLTSTAKRKFIVKLPTSVGSKDSNQLAKRICLKPSTSNQQVKTVSTVLRPLAGAGGTKVQIVKLPPGAILKRIQTVPLLIRSPTKPQTNLTDGKS